MPADGVYPITVPGAVAGWAELLEQHGTITLARALEPAIRYARDGFPVSEIIAAQWAAAAPRLDPAAAAVFLPGGRAPRPGRDLPQPGSCTDAGADRPRRPRRRLPRADWRRDRARTTRSGAGS